MSKTTPTPFSSLTPALHPLLLRALSTLQFVHPTPIQSTLIPLALSSSRDILARARTGSGKTLAYAIPIVQSLLERRDRGELVGTAALVLVPTRELAEQVRGQVGKLLAGLGLGEDEVSVVNVAGDMGGRRKRRAKDSAQGDRTERFAQSARSVGAEHRVEGAEKLFGLIRMQLADRPSIVVATPSRALSHLRSEVSQRHSTQPVLSAPASANWLSGCLQALHLEHLTQLVIDEADLILSYGHSSEDIRSILAGPWGLPKVYQSFLMSATMTGEVEELKGILLRNPVSWHLLRP